MGWYVLILADAAYRFYRTKCKEDSLDERERVLQLQRKRRHMNVSPGELPALVQLSVSVGYHDLMVLT